MRKELPEIDYIKRDLLKSAILSVLAIGSIFLIKQFFNNPSLINYYF